MHIGWIYCLIVIILWSKTSCVSRLVLLPLSIFWHQSFRGALSCPSAYKTTQNEQESTWDIYWWEYLYILTFCVLKRAYLQQKIIFQTEFKYCSFDRPQTQFSVWIQFVTPQTQGWLIAELKWQRHLCPICPIWAAPVGSRDLGFHFSFSIWVLDHLMNQATSYDHLLRFCGWNCPKN